MVNAGVAQGAPMYDLDGNPRDSSPDIGSYEVQPVSTENIFEDDKSLTLMPNPVVYKTNLTIDNNWTGDIEISILDVSGKQVKQISVTKTTEKQSFPIVVNELQKGVHFLLVRQEDRAISKRMIKL